MRRHLIITLFMGLLSLVTEAALAADWRIGGYAESVAIKPDIALREGVEDTAYGIGVEANYFPYAWLDVSMGLGLVQYDDNESFTQTVQGVGLFNNGDVSSESSDASGLLYYVEIGPQYALVDNTLLAFAKAGIGGLESDRSIPNCSDCYEENIDIEAGSYIQLGLAYLFESWELMVKYNSFLQDDGLDNVVRISVRTR